jgi:hypothetical protein
MISSRNTPARQARIQEEREAGSVADRFPEVERIVVTITHVQQGIVRNVWYSPSSYAFFRVSCLSTDCVEGGFDMGRFIADMVRSRSRVKTGDLRCESTQPKACPAHARYEIAISYR